MSATPLGHDPSIYLNPRRFTLRDRTFDNASSFSAFECFELGRVAYLRPPADYYHTLLWMNEALERLKTEMYPSVRETDVLEHLSYAMYHQENVERATVLARRFKKLDPKSTKIDDNLEFYELELMAMHKDPKTVSEATLPKLNLIRPEPENPVPNFDIYEKLCRGDIKTVSIFLGPGQWAFPDLTISLFRARR